MSGAAAGLIALLMFLGAAEVVALAIGPNAAPSIALGQNVIGHTPQSLKEFAITHFGEDDKTVLLDSIYATLAVVAAAMGALASLTRRVLAAGAITALAVVAAASAVTQPTASVWYVLPPVVGAVAAVAAYFALIHDRAREALAEPTRAVGAPVAAERSSAVSRRQLLTNAGWLVAFGGAAYLVGKRTMTSIYNAASSRAAVRLPAPTSSSPAVAGTDLAVPGLAPYITSNQDFYRVDTALVVPQLSTDGYTLSLHGTACLPASAPWARPL